MRNVAFIPARIGSTRLKKKALISIQNETLLSLAIKKSIYSKSFDEIVCLGDCDEFRNIAYTNDIKYIDRDPLSASNEAKADEVVLEIIKKTDSNNIFWINITHPFTKIITIKKAVEMLSKLSNNFDSLYTVHSWHGHASLDQDLNKPINFDINNSFSQTQSLNKLFLLTYGIMAWKSFDYLKRYEKFSSAMLNGKIRTIEVSRLESIWIKYQSDLEMVLEIVNKNNIWNFIH